VTSIATRPGRYARLRARLRRSGRAGVGGGFAERVPLRVRLVVAMLVVVAAAQIVTGLVATAALKRHLIAQLDAQLRASATSTASQVRRTMALSTGDLVRLDLPGAVFVQVSDANGDVRGTLSTRDDYHVPRLPASTGTSAVNHPQTVAGTGGDGPWRLVDQPIPGTSAVLIKSVSLDEPSRTVTNLAVIDAVVSGGVLILLGGVGYLLIRVSLRPLRQVEAVAAAIAEGQLSQRVPARDPRTEVGRLGQSLNAMLARIEGAFRDREASEAQARASEERMRRFIADASHELRTPLTSIRGFAELYRQGAATDESDVARFMRRIESESARMGLLVEDLLLLARIDAQRPLHHRPVELAVLAADAVHDARAVHPQWPIALSVAGPSVVSGDEPRLRQVIGNLITNSITHTPPGTPVAVTVAPDGDAAVVLEVADQGPGMTAEHAARVFERFYRADASRARQTGGNGLGLAIVAAIVAAHHGSVDVVTAPGAGSAFRVRLPALAGSPPPDAGPTGASPPDLSAPQQLSCGTPGSR
jgi:two-component system OmpR family sensor kinase